MNSNSTTARQHRSFVKVGFATVAIVASVTMTAACGSDTTTPAEPAIAPVGARIYPPTDVPQVRYGSIDADAAAGRVAQNEEKQAHAGSRPSMP
jgi:hypothetical protein